MSARILVLAALSAALACGRRVPLGGAAGGGTGGVAGGGAGGSGGSGGAGGTGGGLRPAERFPQNVDNDLDLVFVIDNTRAMQPTAQNLTHNFPTFMNVLKSLPSALPDLHIGVISTAMGAGPWGDDEVPGCFRGGDGGRFQNAPRGKMGTCTALPKGGFIVSLEKGTKNNFSGDISDVFACIAELGYDGCMFPQGLGALRRALGGDGPVPAGNEGFLRPEAYLAVVFLTAQDDCTTPDDSLLFDPKQTSISDPLGPLSPFRCAEFGHLCGGGRPPRTPAMLTDCVPAEDAGRLTPISDMVAFLKALKADPGRILVSVAAGPTSPYSVVGNGSGEPTLSLSCSSKNGSATPGVRLAELAAAFGENGVFVSLCLDNYVLVMDQIARHVGKRLGASCLAHPLVDADLAMPGLQAKCDVWTERATPMGTIVTPLPGCDAARQPCWKLVPNNRACPESGYEIKVDWGGGSAPHMTTLAADCAECTDASDPRCR